MPGTLFYLGVSTLLFFSLQRGVNRLLYGLRDEPYVALARLRERLQGAVEPDAMLNCVVETVRETLKLSYVAIEVQEGADWVLAAATGDTPSTSCARPRSTSLGWRAPFGSGQPSSPVCT